MRVLQVHNHYRHSGGEDAVVKAERELLTGTGHEVIQFERMNPTGPATTAASLLAAPWSPGPASALARLIADNRPHVAHVHNTWFAMSPSVIWTLHRLSVPVVVTAHNYRLACINAQLLRDGVPCQLCVGTHPWKGVQYRCYHDSLAASSAAALTSALHRRLGTWRNRVDVFVVLTEFMRDFLERCGVEASHIVHVPNFCGDPGPRELLPSLSDVVLFVGRLAPEKGLRELIDSWRRTSPDGLRLEIIGEGPLLAELRNLSLPGVVVEGFLDPSEVRHRMLRARALVVPSLWYEGQPMVVLEALAAGLPVFATNLGGLPETIGEGGRLVESWGDFSFQDLGNVDHLGNLARTHWEKRFTPARHLDGLLGAYVAASRRGGHSW